LGGLAPPPIEPWIKEGRGAIRWTRLSCRWFAANAVRLQLHAPAYNLGNFLRTLATHEPIYVAFQMAEAAIPGSLFADILRLIAELRPPPITSTG
jgi:hypothetical protein